MKTQAYQLTMRAYKCMQIISTYELIYNTYIHTFMMRDIQSYIHTHIPTILYISTYISYIHINMRMYATPGSS